MRNALAHAGKAQRRTPGSSPGTSAWIGTAFAQDNAEAARKQWRQVADQAKPRISKLAASMDNAEADVLAYKTRGVSGQTGCPRQRMRSGRYGIAGWFGTLSLSPT
jgi:hypothetical protein